MGKLQVRGNASKTVDYDLMKIKFSAKFGIPVRTLQQWEQGISAPPEYLVRMMAYIMLLEENGQMKHEELSGEEYGNGE